MGVDSQGTLYILHIPTAVSKKDGDTVIRGFSSTSMVTKLEFGISTNSLLDTITTAVSATIDSPNYILPPLDIGRHTKAVKQVSNTMWAPTRAPLIMPLLGNTNLSSVRCDEECALTTATEQHPLTRNWLTATMGFYYNRENGENVLLDCKEHEGIKNSVGLLIN